MGEEKLEAVCFPRSARPEKVYGALVKANRGIFADLYGELSPRRKKLRQAPSQRMREVVAGSNSVSSKLLSPSRKKQSKKSFKESFGLVFLAITAYIMQ